MCVVLVRVVLVRVQDLLKVSKKSGADSLELEVGRRATTRIPNRFLLKSSFLCMM